jgi:hypothetical protein
MAVANGTAEAAEEARKFLETHSANVVKVLDCIADATERLMALGLTRSAAIQHAGEFYNIEFHANDIAQEQSPAPAPNSRLKTAA